MFTLNVVCGKSSTALKRPTVLPLYSLIQTESRIIIIKGQFVSTNANCGINQLLVVNENDPQAMKNEKGELAKIISKVSDTSIQVEVPPIEEAKRTFIFKIKAVAEGGQSAESALITVDLIGDFSAFVSSNPPRFVVDLKTQHFQFDKTKEK